MDLLKMNPNDFDELLGGNRPGCTVSTAGQLQPDVNRRLLFIGLGGQGVKTLEQLKKTMTEQMIPAAGQFAAFLAVDSDHTQLECCEYLTGQELLCITPPGTFAMGQPFLWNRAWHKVAPEQTIRYLAHGVSWDGTGRKRVVGRLKLYSKPAGEMGMDEKLVDRLACIRNEVLCPRPAWIKYDIYVIAGLSGGTGSGLVTEMPALLRQVFRPDEAHIHALVYLPDTVTAMDPMNKDQFQSNGYAALKELEHYQSLAGRPGETAVFPSNTCPEGQITLPLSEGYYASIRPVGTWGGPRRSADEQAREAAVEYLKAILFGSCDLLQDTGLTTLGEAVEQMPRDLAWAWSVSQLIRKAGMVPDLLPPTEAETQALPPFRMAQEYEPAETMHQRIRELMHPLSWYLRWSQQPVFRFETAFGGPPTWQEIMDGTFDGQMAQAIERSKRERSSPEAMLEMEQQVREQFRQYRRQVQDYVRAYGPMAFVNLYDGNWPMSSTDRMPGGIGEWLMLVRDNRNPVNGNLCLYPDIRMYEMRFRDVKNRVWSEGNNLPLVIIFTGRRNQLIAELVDAGEKLINAVANEKRRECLLGNGGILERCFLEPAGKLRDQILCFGMVLERLAWNYGGHARILERCRTEQDPDGMIAGLNDSCYAWLMEGLKSRVDNVNPEQLRSDLVDAFFEDPDSWLRVNPDQVRRSPGGCRLQGKPLNARQLFDRHMATALAWDTVDLSLPTLLGQLQTRGGLEQTSQQLAHRLGRRSWILCDGMMAPEPEQNMVVLIPAALQQMPQVRNVLVDALQQNLGHGCVIDDCQDGDALRLVRTAPLRCQWLRELGRWKDSYHYGVNMLGNGLHGLSPSQLRAQNPDEGTGWSEYPDLEEDDGPF